MSEDLTMLYVALAITVIMVACVFSFIYLNPACAQMNLMNPANPASPVSIMMWDDDEPVNKTTTKEPCK